MAVIGSRYVSVWVIIKLFFQHGGYMGNQHTILSTFL